MENKRVESLVLNALGDDLSAQIFHLDPNDRVWVAGHVLSRMLKAHADPGGMLGAIMRLLVARNTGAEMPTVTVTVGFRYEQPPPPPEEPK